MSSHPTPASALPLADESANKEDRPRFWRSMSELQQSEEFEAYLHREFPVAASEFPEGVSRRRWMQLMAASFAMAGVAASGCRYSEETIEPFVIRPEGRIPGETYVRATNFELADRVYNLLVTCFDGRPIKVEPNPDHPLGGGTDVYAQASVLSLYDPDRARGKTDFLLKQGDRRREDASWEQFDRFVSGLFKSVERNDRGAGFAILAPPTTSPSIVRLLKDVQQRLPKATLARHDSVGGDVMRNATAAVFGKPANQVLKLDEAKVIVALQADLLGQDRAQLSNMAGFAKHRDPQTGDMSRLYVVEGGYTSTGAAADCRLALRPSQMPAFLGELSRRVEQLKSGAPHEHGDDSQPFDKISAADRLERFLDVLAHDLADQGDAAVVVVGEHLGADAVAAGIRLNQQLGSFGKLQTFHEAADADLEAATLAELVTQIDDGEISSLLILGGNPVATAPGDLDVATALAKVEHSVYLGEYDDETGVVCEWSVPLAHPLEAWGDCIDASGHFGVCQPNIMPLLGGRSACEVLATMLGEEDASGSTVVRRTAEEIAGKPLTEQEWRRLLHDGFADGLSVPREPLTPSGDLAEFSSEAPQATSEVDRDDFEVLFVAADGLYDGRFANNGWLQELPQSLTKLCWDNAAVISPNSAKALGIKHGDKIGLRRGDLRVDLPVFEMPGCAPGVVTVAIGYGRRRVGMIGGMPDEDVDVVGIDVSPLRTSDSLLVAYQIEARPKFERYELSTTQDHWAIDELGRDEAARRSRSLVREGTLELWEKISKFATGEPKEPHVPHVGPGDIGSPWKEPVHEIKEENKKSNPLVPQWGMAIDLSKCTGCNACVVACQSENNVPIVGRDQVLNSREMHWLRIDRYFQGDEEHADIVQEPMACQHCETAPCEQVCPVAATVHTNEGINAMAYNRCIGTRYCANNCPFKVRRFNYFNYNKEIGVGYGIDAYPGSVEGANRKLQAMVLNPDVTVRGRGVMEKCTYCVQRVEQAKITARKDGGRMIRDGDVVTACQSACPANAIEFGNLADPESAVSKKHADDRSYGMLSQLNVKPRTEYLARIRNTPKRLMNSFQLDDLEKCKAPHEHHHADGEHGGGEDHGADHDHDEHAHDEKATSDDAKH